MQSSNFKCDFLLFDTLYTTLHIIRSSLPNLNLENWIQIFFRSELYLSHSRFHIQKYRMRHLKQATWITRLFLTIEGKMPIKSCIISRRTYLYKCNIIHILCNSYITVEYEIITVVMLLFCVYWRSRQNNVKIIDRKMNFNNYFDVIFDFLFSALVWLI